MVKNSCPISSGGSKPTVSIIILNYNGREHLDECLSSLRDLEFPKEEREILVVDNASIDGSVDFIRSRFPEVVLIQNESNLGFSRAANLGAAGAAGEYVAFLNNDMRVDRNWLTVLLDTARAGKGFACVGSTVLNWDGTAVDFAGRTDDVFCLAYTSSDEPSMVLPISDPYSSVLFVSGGAALIQRQVFQSVGGFDPDFFLYHEDVDLGWRLWLRGYESALSSESIVYHKGGATSSRLSSAFLQSLSQKHTLFSVFKNLDEANLKEVMPLLLAFLLERGRWLPAARQTFALVMQEFQASLDSLIGKRREVQRTRTKSDADIFALVGHPCDFLFRQSSDAALPKHLIDSCSSIDFDPNDLQSMRSALTDLLNCAHGVYEFHLSTELEELSSRLSAKELQIARMTASMAWRLLNRYGRIKYRYLLPVYRLLRLAPYEKPEPEFNGVGTLSPGSSPRPDHGAREDLSAVCESNSFDVICFPIIGWDFRFQRPQQMMSRFAAAGHRVFYLEQEFHTYGPAYKIRERRKNIYEVSLRGPKRNIYAHGLDDRARDALLGSLGELRRDLLMGATVAFVQLPFWWPLAGKAQTEFAWPVVYDCMDHHAGFSSNSRAMVKQEDDLMTTADLIVVSSADLEKRARKRNSNVLLVRNACDYEHFEGAHKQKGKQPVIGYYGAIADWFDSDLVADLAENRPDWKFVFVGSTYSADTKRLSKLSNVSMPGEKPYSQIPHWLRTFDVVIIPFKRNALTEATNPVKVYEILASGKPLISVPIPEMAALTGLVGLASTAEEFEDEIIAALAEDDPAIAEKRRAFARENTWEQRHEILEPAVREVFPKTSIIVVTFNNLELNRLCLESVYARTEWPNFEVIVVDNASSDGTPDYLKEAEKTFPNLRVILNDTNLGFARANNLGLQQATGAYLVLLYNDTVVTRGWLSALIRHLRADPKIGLIGPVTNEIGNEAKIPVAYTRLEDMPLWAARYVRENDNRMFPIPMLAMFCVAMKREVFERAGLLDETFEVGMFEDDDYTRRVRDCGYEVVCADDSFIHHFGRASFKLLDDQEYHRIFQKNRRIYEEKWGSWDPPKERTIREKSFKRAD